MVCSFFVISYKNYTLKNFLLFAFILSLIYCSEKSKTNFHSTSNSTNYTKAGEYRDAGNSDSAF